MRVFTMMHRRMSLKPGITTQTVGLACSARFAGPCRVWLYALVLVLAGGMLAPLPVLGEEESAEEKGLRLSREADARNSGFEDLTATLTMVLRDRQGRESVRQMRFKVMEVEGDGNKSLFVFDRPKDVSGTALLTHVHINTPDDQWLYLPALKRVKRINSSKSSGAFMGSEFSYEDMSAPELEEYTYRYLRDEPCAEFTCSVIEQVPLDKNSGYSRKILWQDNTEARAWKVELYDRRGSHLKTLTFSDYQLYVDEFWRPSIQTMANHLTGASTELKWTDFRFRTNLDASEFTKPALRRVR